MLGSLSLGVSALLYFSGFYLTKLRLPEWLLINFRNNKMTDIFAAVDMAGVATFVGATGVLIVGVALAYKGISLAKRAVSKA